MPEFILDTSGEVPRPENYAGWGVERALTWRDLDSFTQGYVEALFFTEEDHDGLGFVDLAPEALLTILSDCAAFQARDAWKDAEAAASRMDTPDDAQAGRDFWYTRNGHGCGFWDGDWPEPYATALTDASEAFGAVDAYLGDDGKVYL